MRSFGFCCLHHLRECKHTLRPPQRRGLPAGDNTEPFVSVLSPGSVFFMRSCSPCVWILDPALLFLLPAHHPHKDRRKERRPSDSMIKGKVTLSDGSQAAAAVGESPCHLKLILSVRSANGAMKRLMFKKPVQVHPARYHERVCGKINRLRIPRQSRPRLLRGG